MRRENGARAFIAPPLGGWEGLNLQESVTVDASGGNWHSLLTASPFCPACPGICALAGRRSGTDGRRGRADCASVERVCGRLRRPQSRRCVAVKAEVPWATKVLRGLEPSWRDWRRDGRIAKLRPHAGTNASLTAFRVGGRGSVGCCRPCSCASATG